MNDPNQGLPPAQAQPVQPQAHPAPAPPAMPLVPPPLLPAVPLVPPVLALGPGHILDGTYPAHTKQYYKATALLDSTERFDRQPGKIRLFLAHVED